MRQTQGRVAFGTLAAVALLLGTSALMPFGSAEGASLDGDHALSAELGGLEGVHKDRNGDSHADYMRACNVTARERTDANHDGNGEFAFLEVTCHEWADQNFDGVADAWRNTTANWTRVDSNDDGHPELVEIHIASRATFDPDQDGIMNAVREAAYSARAVDEDSNGHLDGATRELRVDGTVDKNGDGIAELTSTEFKGARATDSDSDGKLDTLAWRHAASVTFDPNSNGTANAAASFDLTGVIKDRNGDGMADYAEASGERGYWVDRNEDGNKEVAEGVSFEAWKADVNFDGRFDVACVNATHRLVVDRNSDGRPELRLRESVSLCGRHGSEERAGGARAVYERAIEVDRDSDGVIDFAREGRVERVLVNFDLRPGADFVHGERAFGALADLSEDGRVDAAAATHTEGDRLL